METEVEVIETMEEKEEEVEEDETAKEYDDIDKNEDVGWKEVVQTAVDEIVYLPNMVEKAFEETCKEDAGSSEFASCMKERLRIHFPRREYHDNSKDGLFGDGDMKKEKENVHQRIDDLCQRIEEKEVLVRKKREELHNLEVESEVEVFEMKQEIISLQAKLDDGGEDEGLVFKKVVGKGWRNSVMQRRIYGRLTKSAKREAEDWARQTKRTLVMEMIKHRKHTWISRPRKQKSLEKAGSVDESGALCYEEHNGIMEIGMDAKIVPTLSFEEIKNQIESKWREEIRIKMTEIQQKKNEDQQKLGQKLEAVQATAEKEKDMLQKEHDNQMYALNKLCELLKKMLLTERACEDAQNDQALWKTEFECPICFEEMKPPIRIWQCVDGHAICEGCREKLESKGCPSCCRSIDGRNIALEKMARSLYGEHCD